MPIDSTAPTSRRGYLSQAELAQFADITIIDETEADDRISQAEELVDAYVGFVEPFFCDDLIGRATGGSSSGLTLESVHQNAYDKDFFVGCNVEIIGGTGAGQRRKITASAKASGILTNEAWTTTPDSTSMYKIYQLGKFPRQQDAHSYNRDSVETTWYKTIPEGVKRAVAAQVEFIIDMGDSYLTTDMSDKNAETIGDYSYSKGGSGAGTSLATVQKMIAPKARQFLRGLVVRTGQFDIQNTL